VRLRLLSRVITNLYDDVLRPLGLKVSQLHILVVTAKLGPAQPAKVCDLFRLDASTLSRNVERLCARAFRLTAQGRRVLERAVPAWEQAQQQAEELLGEDGVALLTKTASKMGMP
jgi:DNA-binding MarR family transcriptional regulator